MGISSLFHHGCVKHRTDIDVPIPYRQRRHVIVSQKEGRWYGCEAEFAFRMFEMDHVIPQATGGTERIDNLHLLRGHCNRTKGDQDQAYLVARPKATGKKSRRWNR